MPNDLGQPLNGKIRNNCRFEHQSGEQVLVSGNFRVLADDCPNRFRLISSNESIVRIPPKRLEIVLVFKMAILATRVSIN